MNASEKLKVLFLCTGNSARSILGEYLLRHLAGHRFLTFSAGSSPTGAVNPLAIEILRDEFEIDATQAESKSVTSLEGQEFDLVLTVCDHAREHCPIFPGATTRVHWGMPDPAAVTGPRELQRQAFQETGQSLHRALRALVSQPIESMEPADLRQRLQSLAPLRPLEEDS